MSTKKLKQMVTDLAAKELRMANGKFPPFGSSHEGYAVVMEEVEEAREKLECVENELGEMWRNVRMNRPGCHDHASIMQQFALELACEAIQVAAMCEKFLALGAPGDVPEDG